MVGGTEKKSRNRRDRGESNNGNRMKQRKDANQRDTCTDVLRQLFYLAETKVQMCKYTAVVPNNVRFFSVVFFGQPLGFLNVDQ